VRVSVLFSTWRRKAGQEGKRDGADNLRVVVLLRTTLIGGSSRRHKVSSSSAKMMSPDVDDFESGLPPVISCDDDDILFHCNGEDLPRKASSALGTTPSANMDRKKGGTGGSGKASDVNFFASLGSALGGNRSIVRSVSSDLTTMPSTLLHHHYPRRGLFGAGSAPRKGSADAKVEELQNLVSSLKERLEESDAKLLMYRELGLSDDSKNKVNPKLSGDDLESGLIIANVERKALREEVRALQDQLRQRDMELTALRLDALADRSTGGRAGGSFSETTGTCLKVNAEEWRRLRTERDNAMSRAGDLAQKLADTKAEADDLQERLAQTQKNYEDLQGILKRTQQVVEERESEIRQFKEFIGLQGAKRRFASPRRTRSSSSEDGDHQGFLARLKAEQLRTASMSSEDDDNGDNDDDEGDDDLANAAMAATLIHLTKKIQLLEDQKSGYEAALEETKARLLGGRSKSDRSGEESASVSSDAEDDNEEENDDDGDGETSENKKDDSAGDKNKPTVASFLNDWQLSLVQKKG